MKIHDVEQGTAPWFKLRSGTPTASEFHLILTPKKQELAEARHKYACRLIAERLLRWQSESLDYVKHVEEGKSKEGAAVHQLEFVTGLQTRKVGFITTDDLRFGASPDRIAGNNDITIEIKAPTIPKQFEYLLLGHDDAYICQVQGQLHVAEADKAIFYSYHERTPAYMIETGRNQPFIKKLADALERFSDELEALTEKARSLGMFQAFAEIVTPAEKELGNREMGPDELGAFLEGSGGGDLRGMA